MNVSFLYPGNREECSLAVTWQLYGRHAKRHNVQWDRVPCSADFTIVVTVAEFYTRETIDRDVRTLQATGRPFIVLHHNEHGQPTPGDYPSACWTKCQLAKLGVYDAHMIRQPSLPKLFPPHSGPLMIGTSGVCEPKRGAREMYERMRQLGLPFVVHTPIAPNFEYARPYQEELERAGCRVVRHEWVERPEQCTWLLDCSHFLFKLTGLMKTGLTGGSSMSPRQFVMFNRPIVLIDDEDTYAQDGFTVVPSLDDLRREHFNSVPPSDTWGVDEYIEELYRIAASHAAGRQLAALYE